MALRQVLLRNSSFPRVAAFFSHEAATVFESSSCQRRPSILPFSTQTWNILHPFKKHTASKSCQTMSKYDLSPYKQSSPAWRKYSRNTRTFSLVPGGTAALTCVAIGATTTKEVTLKRAANGEEKWWVMGDAGRWCQMVLKLDNMWFVKLSFLLMYDVMQLGMGETSWKSLQMI